MVGKVSGLGCDRLIANRIFPLDCVAQDIDLNVGRCCHYKQQSVMFCGPALSYNAVARRRDVPCECYSKFRSRSKLAMLQL